MGDHAIHGRGKKSFARTDTEAGTCDMIPISTIAVQSV